jgi:ferritin
MEDIISKFANRKPIQSSVKVENQERLSPAVQEVLNTQIRNELISSQIYKAMSACLDSRGYINGAKVFFKYGQEELAHMDKIFAYMFDRNCKPITAECPTQKLTYNNVREIIETALNHEIVVTANWDNIANTALANKDNTTYEFSMWFLKEQVEEEDKFRSLLFQMNLGLPDWELENIFKDMLG